MPASPCEVIRLVRDTVRTLIEILNAADGLDAWLVEVAAEAYPR